ncbi:chemotaxis protein CheA [Mucilaginibacter sp. Bleaf8]|uniref:chemotaxis protein CheA n=1 Tax=Mucilaginibacter sp. Bleaf8 TaxID=2834430 RepID=UPI001BCEEF12|nr:chemotaxis protein CheA [Mucilaginibacter sp. Bleaf8]MBS7566790.1 chemotaxis protein CheA [Mucilaginibacter sp. Bleaf8]
MEQYNDTFIEESLELLSEVEKALLLMEVTPHDAALIQQVFRALHTIKGNSSMFGFSIVANFTHQLESVYEYIRNGQQQLTKPILNTTLAAVDHLFTLVKSPTDQSVAASETHKALNVRIATLLQDIEAALNKVHQTPASITSNNDEQEAGVKIYAIHFAPHQELFYNGTNPLTLLADLQSLGECHISCNTAAIPALQDIEPTYCYTSWDIELQTAAGLDAIQQVFLFVTGRCKLDIKEVQPKVDAVDVKSIQAEQPAQAGAANTVVPQRTNVISSIRVPSEKLDNLMGLVSELITLQAKLGIIAGESAQPELMGVSENFEKILTRLRDNAFSLCLLPVKTMLTPFNRLVRDLADELHKEIEFVTEGVETELDKNIIEGLSDPLMHVLRNSVDHGIEDEATRLKLGKRKQGRIVFKAYCAGTNVYIEIQDDGRGMDPEKIRLKAIEKGLIGKDEVLSEAEIFSLIFLPGFSTAERISSISGRGVGMDVVKRKIEDIRGQIKITSVVNQGTTIIIKLPLTVSIIDGLLVQINDGSYVIPLSAVERCLEAPAVQQINHFHKVLILDGQQIPYIDLSQEYGGTAADSAAREVVLVYFEEKRIALLVDRVIGKFQAVLKSLGKHYQKIENISGATILGDGSIALVLDTIKVAEQYLQRKRLTHVS